MPLTLGLGFRLFGIDRLSGVVKKVGRAFREMGRDIANSTRKLGAASKSAKLNSGALLAAGAAAAGFGALVVKAAFDAGTFEQQMGFLRVVTGAAAEEMKSLEQTALDLSTQFGVVPIDVAKTQVALARLGFTAEEVKDLLVPTLGIIVAAMGKLGPEQAGKLLGQTLKSFGLQASDASRIGNQLSTVVARTAIDFDKLGLAIGTAGGFVKQFGGTTSEMITFLGLAADVINRTERGATAVRNIFSDLATTTRQLKIETELGIDVVDRQTGKFKNIIVILEKLFERFGDMGQAARLSAIQTIFSREAAVGLLSMMARLETGIKNANGETIQGVAALRLLEAQVAAGTVTLQAFVEAALGPLPGQMAISRAAMQKMSIAFGKVFGLILGPLIKLVTFLFEGLVTVIQKTGFWGKGLAFIIGVIGVVIGLLGPPLIAGALLVKLFGLGSLFAMITTVGFTAALWSLFKVVVVLTAGFALIALAIGLIAEMFGLFDLDDKVDKIKEAQAALRGVQEDFANAPQPGLATVGGPRMGSAAGIAAFGGDDAGFAAASQFDQALGGVDPFTRPGRAAAEGDIIINLNIDGKRIERVVVKASERRSRKRFGASEATT